MGQIVAWISETGAFFSLFVADISTLPFVVPELSVSPGSLIKKSLQYRVLFTGTGAVRTTSTFYGKI
jgi:hypothetical protein